MSANTDGDATHLCPLLVFLLHLCEVESCLNYLTVGLWVEQIYQRRHEGVSFFKYNHSTPSTLSTKYRHLISFSIFFLLLMLLNIILLLWSQQVNYTLIKKKINSVFHEHITLASEVRDSPRNEVRMRVRPMPLILLASAAASGSRTAHHDWLR